MTGPAVATNEGRFAPPAAPSWLTPERRRAVRHGLVLAGVLGLGAAAYIAYISNALDAHAYWSARAPNLYSALPGTPLAYLYSPAFAQAIAPLQWLPEQAFVAGWIAAIAMAMAWLAGPRLLPLALLVAYSDLQSANIHTLMAVAIVVGFRYPAAWAFPLLTKVTPGVGLVWFARRRAWRNLAIALGVTAAVAVVSFIADPGSWFGWLDLLTRSASVPAINLSAFTPLWLRIPIAALICWWGAGRDAKWTVPVAVMLALPVVWPASLALLLAAIPLAKDAERWRPSWRRAFS
jgi:Glycosyltransferase family 87